MPGLLLGITLIYWAAGLLTWITLNNTVLGILALVTGILFVLVSIGVAVPVVPVRRSNDN